MGISQLISFIATTGLLLLVVLILWRGRKSPLRLPAALLALDMFVWNFATLALSLGGPEAWRWVDNAASPLTPPLALHVVLVFVGKMPRLRWVAGVAYAGGLSLGLVSLAALVSPAAAAWVASSSQSVVYLTFLIPEAALMAVLLLTYLRRQVRESERMRSRLLLTALGLGSIFGSTESWNELLPLPALGQLGAMSMALMVALVVVELRSRSRDGMLLARSMGYALGLTLLALTGYLAVVRWASTHIALALLAGSAITVTLLLAAAEVLHNRRRNALSQQQRLLVDDLSSELAHEIKNPLAALKCANDVLRHSTRPLTDDDDDARDKAEFHALIDEQVARIDQVVERFRRVGAELRRRPIRLEPLLEEIIDERLSDELKARGLRVDLRVAPLLPKLEADPLQLGQAFEELVREALQNVGDGELLELRAELGELDVLTPALVVSVCSAPREHPMFRPESFGIGLIRQIVEAHGGELRRKGKEQIQLLMPLG